MPYVEEEFLPLSGIQHFAFCKRQWSLATIDGVWEENLLTTLGALLHERAHDSSIREHRGDLIIVRGLWIVSRELGLSGVCDVVEFHRDPHGLPLTGEEGRWSIVPVEYKKGSRKRTDADRLQVCAQAMCLEEMTGADIPKGYLFYGASKSREQVEFGEALRGKVRSLSEEMHEAYRRQRSYKPRKTNACRSCSLADDCMPDRIGHASVREYVQRRLRDSA